MSAANDCSCACPDPTVVEVPGSTGAAGAAGATGLSSYTTLTAQFTVPLHGQNDTADVESSEQFAIGQAVYLEGAGTFEVISKPSSTQIELQYYDFPANTGEGLVIVIGSQLSASGSPSFLIANVPNPFTDNSGGTASDTIAATVGTYVLSIPITLAQITGAGDVLTTYTPGHAFEILGVDARVVDVVTTAGDAATINLEINTTDLTGGAVALASANCTPLGAAIAGSPVTGNNVGTAAQSISVEASSVTAFAEGSVVLLVKIRNLDTVNAIASFAAHIDGLISALV